MVFRVDGWAKLGLALVAVILWVSPPTIVAQQGPMARAGGRAVAGGWAEVVSVTNKWLVIQNERGQQFPVASDSVDLFFIRWPTTPDRVSPDALVAATGLDNGSMEISTDHVDVYEGAARALVAPTFVAINGAGGITRPIDYVFDAAVYGEAFPGVAPSPFRSGVPFQPPQIHIVGNLVGANPIRISNQGGNAVSVVPAGNILLMNQITPGSFSLLRPGDTIYFAATNMGPRSLALSQLVAYKRVPFR
jgi:hypothetical protein